MCPRTSAYFWRRKGFLLGARRDIFFISRSEGHSHCAGSCKVPAEDWAKALSCKELSAFQESSRQLQLINKGISDRLGFIGMQQSRGNFLSRKSKNMHSKQRAFLTIVKWVFSPSAKGVHLFCRSAFQPFLSSH